MTYHAKPKYHEYNELVLSSRVGEDQVHSMVPVDYDAMAHGRMHNEIEELKDWNGTVGTRAIVKDDYGD